MEYYKSKFSGERIDELLTRIEEGDITPSMCEEVKYEDLIAMQKDGTLTAGAWYRITDYMTETSQIQTQSAGHGFDILVLALDNKTLSEECRAMRREGDTYFRHNDLEAWKVWYSTSNSHRPWGVSANKKSPEQWSCAWGVLDSNPSPQGSSNYTTAEVDGKTIYLYRPTEPTNFLDDKEFYTETIVSQITSPDELTYEADSAPSYSYDEEFGESYDFPSRIDVKSEDGNIITTFLNSYDNYYYDQNDSEHMYEISFSDSYEEGDGVYYLTPDYGIDYWWDDFIGGPIKEVQREIFSGSYESLRYAFDKVLPQSKTQPKPRVYSIETGAIYESDNWEDSVEFTKGLDGGKGIIYRLIDEFNNDLPFDFKNIQHEFDGDLYYTFGVNDNSLINGNVYDNYIRIDVQEIPRFIFTSDLVYSNRIISHNPEDSDEPRFCVFKGSFYYNCIELRDVTEIICSNSIVGSYIRGTLSTLTSTNVIQNCNITTLGSSTVIDIKADLYACDINTQPRGGVPLVIISGNKGRMQFVNISGTGTIKFSSESGGGVYLTYSNINTGMQGANIWLVEPRTTSLSQRLEGLQIDILNTTTEKKISTAGVPMNAGHKTNIATNSSGEVKIWCDADKV